MKRLSRVCSMVMVLALVLALSGPQAAAVTFSDMTDHWARADVEELANKGIINGYSDGTFLPDAKMSAAEALLFCARVTSLDSRIQAQVAEKHQQSLSQMLPEVMRSWAIPEMAVCLETGIISSAELSSMCSAGAISQAITRENLSLYLVRAMQLEPMVKNLTTYTLPFADSNKIAPSMQPYVYLLYSYGVVGGNENNEFMPTSTVSRAEMAVMLKRALEFMADKQVEVELPAYTTNDWVGGVVVTAVPGSGGSTLLTFNSDFTGTSSISLPSDVRIYENNMITTSSALQAGKYVRVNLSFTGRPETVRIGGTLTTYSGTVTGLSDGVLTILADGISRQFTIDRFTQVQVGQTVGDNTLVDESAGYTSATCRVDSLGHLAGVQLLGGTRQEEGLIKSVTFSANGAAVLQVTRFNGETQRYTVPAGTGVLVNGLTGTLSSTYVGDYVTLRVSNDNTGEVSAVMVDTITQYIQGSIKSVRTSVSPSTITINDFATGKSATYNVASGAIITYNGDSIGLSRLENGYFVTLRLYANEAAMIQAYPGSSTVQGVITAINYGATTDLTVALNDGTTATYTVDLTNPPDIYRGNTQSTIDKLKAGDAVTLTVRYNQVTRIDATPQTANMEGTITRVTMEATGVTLEITLTDGSSVSYLITEGVSISQDGSALSMYALKPGYQVALVVNNDQVVSIEVDKASGSSTQITGTVLYVNTSDYTVLLQWNDSSGMTNVTTIQAIGASVLSVGGNNLSLSSLETGDTVQVYGGYDGLNFRASLIIRL